LVCLVDDSFERIGRRIFTCREAVRICDHVHVLCDCRGINDMGDEMSKLIQFAKEFALKHHGNQEHGCLKIDEHLSDVSTHVSRHARLNDVENVWHDIAVASAWLHDVIEDTEVTENKLSKDLVEAGFGFDDVHYVLDIVNAVTDKPGKSRKERHINTYWKIRDNPRALLIKLCDRRHNHDRSIKHGEIYAAMYAKEYDYFKFALWKPRQFPELWAELDNQNKRLQEIVGW
jgi:(p)ppGpp synthase/HD superfamily hydrolase